MSLRELDEAVTQAVTKEQIQDIANALRIYEKEISENWLVEKNSRFYFNLKNALIGVKRDTQEKLNDDTHSSLEPAMNTKLDVVLVLICNEPL